MIARAFADGLRNSKTGELVVTGSRSLEKGQSFAEEFGGAASDYEGAVTHPEVDAVYNALPHHLHEEWTIRCAEEGKAILCEKPFTLDAESAERALAAVKEHGVFFMEAFMWRCYPQTDFIREKLADGTLGKLLHVSAEFGFAAAYPWENFRTVNAYGGGALMDVGCYCVSGVLLATSEEPLRAHYTYVETAERYDRLGAGVLEFPSGLTADFRTAVHHQLANKLVYWGDEGKLVIHEPWFGEGKVELFNAAGTDLKETWEFTLGSHRYGLEADTVAAHMGGKEAPQMTIDETLRVMRTLDALRASAGFIFDPVEEGK